jgi:hypothetical protein
MKQNFIVLGFLVLSLFSCKNKEKRVLEIVDKVLTQINDKKEGNLDTTVFSSDYYKIFKSNPIYSTNDWSLKFKKQNDSIFIVEANGKTHNGFGMEIKNHQEFKLVIRDGKFKIIDSYNLIALFLNMEIVEKEWTFFWDKQKEDIINELEQNLKLEVLKKGFHKYTDASSGELRLINNSKYDISNVEILIEHYDNEGKSVNTDTESVSEIIRANGYREFDWYTSNCRSCETQKFKIKFRREL